MSVQELYDLYKSSGFEDDDTAAEEVMREMEKTYNKKPQAKSSEGPVELIEQEPPKVAAPVIEVKADAPKKTVEELAGVPRIQIPDLKRALVQLLTLNETECEYEVMFIDTLTRRNKRKKQVLSDIRDFLKNFDQ